MSTSVWGGNDRRMPGRALAALIASVALLFTPHAGDASDIVNTGATTSNGSGTLASITHGLTINSGDVIVAFIVANSAGNTITDNNGANAFTEAIQEDTPGSAATLRYAIHYRVAGASEPAGYSWTLSGSDFWSIAIRVFSGVDTASVWDVAPSASTRTGSPANGTTATAPSMTTTTAGAMGIAFFSTDDTNVPIASYSNPTNGYGLQVQTGSGVAMPQSSFIRVWAAPGSTGTTDVTVSESQDWVAHQFALRPGAATPRYRSAGITATALESGGGNPLSISGSTATFAGALAVNVGVGDAIQYDSDGNSTIDAIAFIHARTSPTVYTVRDAAGGVPTAVAGDNDWAIYRAYTSLSNWVAQTENVSIDAAVRNFDTSTDLVGPGVTMNVACYDDGPMDDVVTVAGWTTAAANYVRIFTPTSATEVGVSQRHSGSAGGGFRLVPVVDSPPQDIALLTIDDEYVRVEGVEIDGSSVTNARSYRGIYVTAAVSATSDVRISHNIVHDLHVTNAASTNWHYGINVSSASGLGPVARVSNNIIYALTNPFNNFVSHVVGISIGQSASSYVYGNTVYNIRNTGPGPNGAAWGIQAINSAVVFAKNNYVGDVVSDFDIELCYDARNGATLNQEANVASDATAGGPGSVDNMSAYASYFRNQTPGSADLHLLSDSLTLWGANGADLDGDANLALTDDIDGGARDPATPDIGADEFAAGPVSTLYRSVGPGTTTPLATGGANALTISGTTASFAVALPGNVGLGDVIQYDSDDNGSVDAVAFIHRRTSASVYTVVSASGGVPAATAAADNDWSVLRAYTSLFDAERGAENVGINAALRNFDTWSGGRDLVANNEVWNIACYGDAPDTQAVLIDGWNTGATNYLRIATPNSLTQVGTSQRHVGVWDAARYVFAPSSGPIGLQIADEYVRIEGLQVMVPDDSTGVDITFGTLGTAEIYFTHNIVTGATSRGTGVDFDEIAEFKVSNNIVYGFSTAMTAGYAVGLRLINGRFRCYNNTVVGNRKGIRLGDMTDNSFRNNIAVGNSVADFAEDGFFNPAQSFNNVSSDLTAPGASSKTSQTPTFVNAAAFDYHLDPSDTVAADSGADLSNDADHPIFIDIDGGVRQTPWDIGADDIFATTAVELLSFGGIGLDRAVELLWETGSELNNLGFHLYRATSPDGPFARITSRLVPGLGSSPEGATYTHVDGGLTNGVTYYYELEDIETTGTTELHGPVSATPRREASGRGSASSGSSSEPGGSTTLITYGDPSSNALRVLKLDRGHVVLELRTEGFYAEPQEDGSIAITIPDFTAQNDAGSPAIPVRRTWVDALAGRKVRIRSVQARSVEAFTSLRPSDAETVGVVATPEGTVRLMRRRARTSFRGKGLSPSRAARIVSVGFQGEAKKALVELAPLRWDASRGQLLLARRLVVRLSFREREPTEESSARGARGRRYQRKRSHNRRQVVADLATTQKGLHSVRYEEVMRGRRGVRATALRLSRQGETVGFHVEPKANRFAPGSVLYFLSQGAEANPYGDEAVYELEVAARGEVLPEVSAAPSGQGQPTYWHRTAWEQDRYYQAALVDALDPWLWDSLFAPETKSYPIDVSALAGGAPKLSVRLQGASDFPANPDHHVRVYVNGSAVEELSWNGKQAKQLDVDLAPGLLREGHNVLELENVGDTAAAHSMVMLDGYAVEYQRYAVTGDGRLRGRWSGEGTAELSGFVAGTHVLNVSEAHPSWLVETEVGADGVLRFRTEAGRSYLAVSPEAVYHPVVRVPRTSRLKNTRNRADYLLIAPEAFLDTAAPLVQLRRNEGLKVEALAIEEIYSEFGFGETSPEAVKEFLSYAYHQWRQPSPRYVLLVGDATYDFKDRLQTGVKNQVPPRMVKTSYLWTASDPSYAAVNGDDLLPDLAIGRLPAATADELQAMVEKIVAYEKADAGLHRSAVVLVADNPDRAGNFEADADALAAGVLASRHPEKIFLSQLGTSGTRDAIVQSFGQGASLLSYLGHGGIHLWADENFFNASDVASLGPQAQQPLVLTMNCLNGYFHFPYFSSLAEELVGAREKGAIAAFSPSGLSVNGPANLYHRALVQELVAGNHGRLGDAILAAQQAYAETGAFPELLSIYHLFGDPALNIR